MPTPASSAAHDADAPTRGATGHRFLNAFSLCFMAVMTYHLILHAAGLSDPRSHGLVYALALFASAAAAAWLSPFTVAERWPADAPPPAHPRPPRLRFYAGFALLCFATFWALLRLLEAVAVASTGQAPWPVSGLTGTAVLAAATLAGTGMLAWLHLRMYRRLLAGMPADR